MDLIISEQNMSTKYESFLTQTSAVPDLPESDSEQNSLKMELLKHQGGSEKALVSLHQPTINGLIFMEVILSPPLINIYEMYHFASFNRPT